MYYYAFKNGDISQGLIEGNTSIPSARGPTTVTPGGPTTVTKRSNSQREEQVRKEGQRQLRQGRTPPAPAS